jgi:hypothetical protein
LYGVVVYDMRIVVDVDVRSYIQPSWLSWYGEIVRAAGMCVACLSLSKEEDSWGGGSASVLYTTHADQSIVHCYTLCNR